MFAAALGIIAVIAAILLILGYVLSVMALIVIGWIGVGIVVFWVLFIGYVWLDEWASH